MQPISYPTRLRLVQRAGWQTQRRDRSAGRPRRARGRASELLRGLPRWLHTLPYGALVLLCGALLVPGLVPHGPSCDAITGAASLSERDDQQGGPNQIYAHPWPLSH
jgi:hypothetical protein